MKISTKEELVLDRWRRGDPEALGDLLQESGKPLYGFLAAVTRGAEALSGELFVGICAETLRQMPESAKPIPLSLQFLRLAVQRVKSLPQIPAAGAGSGMIQPVARDRDVEVRISLCLKILGHMELDDRLFFLLRDLGELTFSEIAYVMDVPEDRVKARLLGARIRFREKMNESLQAKDFYDL